MVEHLIDVERVRCSSPLSRTSNIKVIIMDLKSTYNRIAEDWAKDHKDDIWWKKGTDKFASLLMPGASLLDVGCGAGIKSKYFAEKGFKVTGVDFSEGMLKIAKREVPSAHFFVKGILEIETLENEFDAIYVQAVLLHVPKERVEFVLEKLKNKLTPNGILYLGVKEVRPNAPDEEVVREDDYGYDYERFFSYFTKAEMEDYVNKIGLELVWTNISSSGKTNWIEMIVRNT